MSSVHCPRPSSSSRFLLGQKILWVLAAVAAGINIHNLVTNAKPLGVDWREPGGTLLDFRDLVVVPGRYLWQGGNPYDPVPYLAAHPWAQEFDPYSPAWLLISAAIGWMPHKWAAVVYLLAMTGISFLFARMLARWAVPRWACIAAPLLAIWFQIWFPARGMGSSFLVVIGIALTLVSLDHPDGERGWKPAIGIALAVLKPQFGVPFLLFLLALREWRTVARGLVLAVASALPALIACVVAAGGPSGFIGSIIRVTRHASSPDAPTGLLAANSHRVDIAGLAVRIMGEHPGPVPALISMMLFGSSLLLIWYRRPAPRLAALVIPAAIYLLPVHLSYDIALVTISAAAAASLALTRGVVLSWLTLAFAFVPMMHLHRITGLLGLSPLGGDLLDAASLLIVFCLGTVAVVQENSSKLRIP
ncbi:glycosyltransferase family 87 protein [Luteococcus sp. OSA5]|uniref:glycosyltransferase family 87 protein n=1 Tax=Luteococcus sp. OSA5 TaxID=3401630 RepID=UPI003B42AA1C